MTRAAIIIAGPAEGNVACHVWVAAGDGSDTYLTVHPSEQLLADLRTVVRFPGAPDIPPVSAEAIQDARDRKQRAVAAADRVRALLPNTKEEA